MLPYLGWKEKLCWWIGWFVWFLWHFNFILHPGKQVHLIWTYSDMDITNERNCDIHSSKGFSPQKVVVVPDEGTTTTIRVTTNGATRLLQAQITGTVVLRNFLTAHSQKYCCRTCIMRPPLIYHALQLLDKVLETFAWTLRSSLISA